jgi:hypothetical protein
MVFVSTRAIPMFETPGNPHGKSQSLEKNLEISMKNPWKNPWKSHHFLVCFLCQGRWQ